MPGSLGYDIAWRANDTCELDAVPRELSSLFSSRTKAMEAQLEVRGRPPGLATRRITVRRTGGFTRRSPPGGDLRHRRPEHLAAVRVVAEHVEAGARGRQQHGVARLGELARARAPRRPCVAARSTGTHAARAPPRSVGRPRRSAPPPRPPAQRLDAAARSRRPCRGRRRSAPPAAGSRRSAATDRADVGALGVVVVVRRRRASRDELHAVRQRPEARSSAATALAGSRRPGARPAPPPARSPWLWRADAGRAATSGSARRPLRQPQTSASPSHPAAPRRSGAASTAETRRLARRAPARIASASSALTTATSSARLGARRCCALAAAYASMSA